jgi:tRNA threonylcarbamoyladenosine biosynthesis protein TsaB
VIVVALDTSTALGALAVVVDGVLRAEVAAGVKARHGEQLLPRLASALEWAEVERTQIDLFAVGLGPGSFTGTRVGVSVAKGLALALDRPLVGLSTLRVLARGVWPAPVQIPIADAHKGEIYAAVYAAEGDTVVQRLAPFHAPPAEAAALLAPHRRDDAVLLGSGLRRYPTLAEGPGRVATPLSDAPRALWLAELGRRRFEARGSDDLMTLEPMYVRPSDAKKPTPR